MRESVLSIPLGSRKIAGMESLGQRIKRAMDARRPPLRGYQLAALLERQQSYISKLINDQIKETPPPEVLQGLERVLGIPVPWSLRALGYALDDPAVSGANPMPSQLFPPGSPVAEFLDIVKALPEREVVFLLRAARDFRGWEDDDRGHGPNRQLG